MDRLELEDTKFYVITEANWEKIFAQLVKKNYDPVLFGVTDDGYQILSVNNAKVLQMVMQQKAVIEAYEQYYERTKDAIQRNNDDLAEQETVAGEAQKDADSEGAIIPNGKILKRLFTW